jgi:hypothetical protein
MNKAPAGAFLLPVIRRAKQKGARRRLGAAAGWSRPHEFGEQHQVAWCRLFAGCIRRPLPLLANGTASKTGASRRTSVTRATLSVVAATASVPFCGFDNQRIQYIANFELV